MKKFVFKIVLYFMPVLAKIFKVVAHTGQGTDVCLKNGFLPVPIGFFHPIPDIMDLEKRNVWEKKSDLSGIDFRVEKQVSLLKELGSRFGNECNWPPNQTKDPLDFFTENNSFSFGCASILHSMIRNFAPKRIIEIGSGNSSKIISSVLGQNRSEYTIIDPYASELTERLPNVNRIIKEKVELTDLKKFEELGQNDILFIDSGHTVRIGSDVNFLFLDVLPRLSQGVIVHIHDIGLPYEYPKSYYTNPSFRVFWTEAYLLQAFLCLNPYFEVMLAMSYLMTEKNKEFSKAFPYYNSEIHKNNSGSFWIRRVK